MAFERGMNPVWLFDNLVGNLLDDTYFLFILQNDLPYLPATVYNDAAGTTPWTNPIQFLANGTLPVNIFFDPDVVYRLEVRAGNTQSDALIYLVEDYVPGGSGSSPSVNVSLPTDNNITNPQFSILSFESPYTLTNATDPDPIDVAPGWQLNLAGTGNVTVTRIPLDSTQANITNAPYALQITLTGAWTGIPYLSQRFNQNGMLWSQKHVSSSITARVDGAAINISARLDDSNGSPLVEVLEPITISSNFEEYKGVGLVPVTTNPDVPPVAWIEYKLFLPTTVDIFVTSFQLVTADTSVEYGYEQDTIERQQDYTWHYYRESVLRQSRESILTGWDFGLNPWQFHVPTTTNLATFGYVADQTIVVQQEYVANTNGNNISTERAGVAQNYGFMVTSVTALNQFALVQYIDATTTRPYWGDIMSAYVKLDALKQNPNTYLPVKMRVLYRSSVPATLAQADPIATWAADGEPVYAAGWTAVSPKNDPVYNIDNGDNTLLFEGIQLPASDNAAMTLAVVIYTVASMDSSGTPDNIVFNRVSLVNNDFAIDCNSLSFDETLRRCEYYYSKSFATATVPAQSAGQESSAIGIQNAAAVTANAFGPIVTFPVKMRATPTITLYNPSASNAQIRDIGAAADWSSSVATLIDSSTGFVATGTTPGGSTLGNGALVHWSSDGRIGL